ncbi:nuclear transport factor 2 family protein [Ornithinimicrobium cavernae]|uniref:nuclear transport factor 2 family protein n=1 Tax=Ornithinimicrobium cavernae TaxID=2666047 RepID=UPI000D69D900|nr:nuclear transport factor 2 family protein [Ornithinimicrobium cavernae]
MDLRAITHRYYRAVDAGDVPGVLDWFADDAVYHRPGYEPMRGREALEVFYAGERVIESGSHRIDQLVVDTTSVAVRGVFSGRLKDGSVVEVGFADLIDYDADGRARERHSYFDRPAV